MIELPILYREKQECCGCFACFSICPVGAISMEMDQEGFNYPSIDNNKCVHCLSCIRVCPFKMK